MITSPSDAIKILGGPKVVSDRTGRPFTTVASWASRESIPAEAWVGLVALAGEAGVSDLTYEVLAHVHAKQSRRPKRRKAA